MITIDIRLQSARRRGYPVSVQAGLLARVPRLLARTYRGKRIWIVTDSHVLRLYGRSLQRTLVRAGIESVIAEIPPGERSKRQSVVNALQTQMLMHGIDRRSLIIALGGGVVGDVAGFAAATLLRGIEFIQIPTTLLSQVDSSVGGKVGINHRRGKNLIGAFHHPSAVYVDPTFLRTLPAREFRSGLAEMVKTAAALDRGFFRLLERTAGRVTRAQPDRLAPLIARSIRLKAGIVMKDDREGGLRKVLNLGHTIGHAVESASEFELLHGEAVAIGLACEARIAEGMGILSKREHGRLIRLLEELGLPVRIPQKLRPASILRAMTMDKKSEAGGTRFVLLKRPGDCLIGVQVPTVFLSDVLTART